MPGLPRRSGHPRGASWRDPATTSAAGSLRFAASGQISSVQALLIRQQAGVCCSCRRAQSRLAQSQPRSHAACAGMDGCSHMVTVLTGDSPNNQNSFFAPSVYTLTMVDSRPAVSVQRCRGTVRLCSAPAGVCILPAPLARSPPRPAARHGWQHGQWRAT